MTATIIPFPRKKREPAQPAATVLSAEAVAEALERAPEFIAEYESQIGQGRTLLAASACERGCVACFRECAVRRIVAKWWSKELASAEGQAVRSLTHDGTLYPEPMGSC